MAKLIKQVLGKVSGAVGDVLFRVRAGNNYVGTRPASYMPGTDAKSVARRQRFALANKFAKAVNIIPPLKSLWKQFKSPTNDNLLPTCFLSLLSPVVPTSITQPLTFVTPLSDTQAQLFDSYSSHKMFFVFVTSDADKKTIHYSNTYKKE